MTSTAHTPRSLSVSTAAPSHTSRFSRADDRAAARSSEMNTVLSFPAPMLRGSPVFAEARDHLPGRSPEPERAHEAVSSPLVIGRSHARRAPNEAPDPVPGRSIEPVSPHEGLPRGSPSDTPATDRIHHHRRRRRLLANAADDSTPAPSLMPSTVVPSPVPTLMATLLPTLAPTGPANPREDERSSSDESPQVALISG